MSGPSLYLRNQSGRVLRLLQGHPRSCPELVARLGCSAMTVHRAIRWLRSCDVPIVFSRVTNLYEVGHVEDLAGWTLADLVATQTIDPGEAHALATLAACSQKRIPR